jgi:hypothetical protein
MRLLPTAVPGFPLRKFLTTMLGLASWPLAVAEKALDKRDLI